MKVRGRGARLEKMRSSRIERAYAMSLIGGVKEKVISAKRAEIVAVILPTGNESDYDGMQSYPKESLEAHLVSGYQDEVKILCIER